VKVYRNRRELWGSERTLLVVFSPTFYRKQRATLTREQEKADERLAELARAIGAWRESRRGKGHAEASVRRKIRRWTGREHLREFLDVELEVKDGKAVELTWRWDRTKKRAVQRRYLGKQILVTDRHDWDDVTVVSAYRRLTRTESLFRISKSRPGVWWPMFHWTDSKIRVHSLYCFFALLLLAVLRLELREAGLRIHIDRAIRRLRALDETLVVYADGGADRVLTDMDPTQRELADALDLAELASALGTTVLADA